MNLLAIDVDVSSVNASVHDAATGALHGEIVRVEFTAAAPSANAAEVPAPRLWEAVGRAARRAVRASGIMGRTGRDVAGIRLGTFLPGLLVLDKRNQPLVPIGLPGDKRVRSAARQVHAHVGAEFLAAFGMSALVGSVSALHWRQRLTVDPYLSHHVHTYLHVGGWLVMQMTGARVFDPGNAQVTGLCRRGDMQWSPRWCDYFEVDHAWLPPIVRASAPLGTVSSMAATDLGVPAGIPVWLELTTISSNEKTPATAARSSPSASARMDNPNPI